MSAPWTPESDEWPPATATRDDIEGWVNNHAQDRGGTTCPSCRCRVADDPYSLRHAWVEVLRRLYQEGGLLDWLEIKQFNTVNGVQQTNATFLMHWHLIERQPGRREDGYHSTGLYRPTQLGLRFLQGREDVPRRILKRRNNVRFEDVNDRVFIYDIVPTEGPWNFDAFMRGEG